MIKKVIFGVVAVVLVGLTGRGIWAYLEVKKDIAREAVLNAEVLRLAEEEARAAAILAGIPKAPEGCPETKQQDEIWITGRVVFPKGIKTSADYFATSNGVTYPIKTDGTFCVISVAGQTALVTASATSTKNSFVLSALYNSNSDSSEFLIDATSTAISLVYSSPLVGPGAGPNILDAVATSTAVLKFATNISTATTLSSNDIATGGKLVTAYNTAVKSVQPKAVAPVKSTPTTKTTTTIPKPVVKTPTVPATTTPTPTAPAPTTGTEPVVIDTPSVPSGI